MNSLSKKICVIGGAGAIGSRLVQSLIHEGHEVTVVVRRLSSAIRIGRFDIEIKVMDLAVENVDSISKVMNGAETVIDCSFVGGNDCELVIQQSEDIASKIKKAADAAGVRHLIHFGTISVYPAKGTQVSEDTPCDYKGEAYGDGKLAAERRLLKNDGNVRVTVLQLPIVFGPFMNWSTSVICELTNATLVGPDHFKGWCTPIFVDDVVKATQLAISKEFTENHKILIWAENITWQDYYKAHTNLSDSLDFKMVARAEYESLILKQDLSHRPFSRLKDKFSQDGEFRQLVLAQFGFRHIYGLVKRHKGQSGIDRIKASISDDSSIDPTSAARVLISSSRTRLYDSLPKIKSNRARELLGFEPSEFHEGLAATGKWLRWYGLIVD